MSDKEFHFKGKVYAVVPDVVGESSCRVCAFSVETCSYVALAELRQGMDCVGDEHHYVEKGYDDEI